MKFLSPSTAGEAQVKRRNEMEATTVDRTPVTQTSLPLWSGLRVLSTAGAFIVSCKLGLEDLMALVIEFTGYML